MARIHVAVCSTPLLFLAFLLSLLKESHSSPLAPRSLGHASQRAKSDRCESSLSCSPADLLESLDRNLWGAESNQAASRSSSDLSKANLIGDFHIPLLHKTRPSPPGTQQLATQQPSSWRFLYQNDGDWSSNKQAGFLLSGQTAIESQAAAICNQVSERLATVTSPVDQGLQRQLAYAVYDKTYRAGQQFRVAEGRTVTIKSDGTATVARQESSTQSLPVLCTQSAPRNAANNTASSESYRVQAGSFLGYRDGRSFRFGGIPFANSLQRFEQSSPRTSYPASVKALLTDRSKQCPQRAGTDKAYTEDCLVLNVYTPAIGESQSESGRPVMVYVHGGGFSSGSGLDFTFDGGEIASRGDAVVVTPNYRIGSLGFLSINDQAKGNYGVNDVVTALKWVQKNAASFGGDASRVLLFGQSAGAQIVEALLGSPAAQGLFSKAIVQSGRPQDRKNALKTVQAVQAGKSGDVIKSLGCGDASDKLACLRQVPVSKFLSTSQFSSIIVDGKTITGDTLDVAGKRGGHINKVPVIFGFMRDEAGALGYVPPRGTSFDDALKASDLNGEQQQAVSRNRDLFLKSNVRRAIVGAETDGTSIKRCGQESTMLAAAQSGNFPAVYGYTQDQRALQIPNYDPSAVCQSRDPSKPYYFCHSGDLLPTFGTAGYAFMLPPRDQGDITWSALMIDQWTAFARTGSPTPPTSYLKVRGYSSTETALAASGGKWQRVSTSASSAQIMSLGPQQRMVSLRQRGAQCDALGLNVDYVSQGK